jgi:hypothetical protein
MALPFYKPYRGSIGRFFGTHPKLVWYSQLDGSSMDNSGNGNDGSDSNVSYVFTNPIISKNKFFNKNRLVAYFNGSNASTFINNNLGIGNGVCTIMGWFSISSQIGSGQWTPIVVCDSTTKVYYRIGVYSYNAGNRQFFFTRGKNGNGENNFAITLTLEIGKKYFFALTYDGTTLHGYINGVWVGSVAASGDGTVALTNGMRIGSWITGSDELWNGEAGEVAVFKEAVPAAFISQYYNWATASEKREWWIISASQMYQQAVNATISAAAAAERGIQKAIYTAVSAGVSATKYLEKIIQANIAVHVSATKQFALDILTDIRAHVTAVGGTLYSLTLQATASAHAAISTSRVYLQTVAASIAGSASVQKTKTILAQISATISAGASVFAGILYDVTIQATIQAQAVVEKAIHKCVDTTIWARTKAIVMFYREKYRKQGDDYTKKY